MKKLYITACLAFAAASIFAQTTITYKQNGLNIGDARPMKEIEHLDQGNGGAYQNWDFSGAKEKNSMTITQNENVATSIGGLDLTSRNTLLACDEGGEKTTYFEITPTEKKYYGLTNGTVTIAFNQPIVDLKFPFSYGESVSGAMDGTYTDIASSSAITGTYVTKADAYGTLSLPDGSKYNNVLRVKVEKNYEQESGNTTYTINTVRYQYFAEGQRYPVLIVIENKIDSDCHCSCGHYTTNSAYYLPASNNVKSESVINNGSALASVNKVKLSVYPNPFKEEVNATVKIDAASEADVEIIDASGRKIKDFGKYNLVEGSNEISLESADIVPGHYFLRVTVDGVNYAKSIIKK